MSWGHEMRNDTERDRKSTGGGKSGKKWSQLIKLDETPITVHLGRPEEFYTHPVSGNSYPFRPGFRYYLPWGGKKGNGTYIEKNFEQDIIGAYTNPQALDLAIQVNTKLAKLEARPYVAVSGWVEDWYHRVQRYIDDADESKGTFWSKEPCMGKGCELCQHGAEQVFGNKFWAIFSMQTWKPLHNKQLELEMSTRAGNRMYIPEYVCESCSAPLVDVCNVCDKCGGTEIEMDDESLMARCVGCNNAWSFDVNKNKGILDKVNRKIQCPNCRHNAFARAVKEPMIQGDDSGELGIFDCRLTLKQTGKGKDSQLHILGCEQASPDPRLFDQAHQGSDAEWAPKFAEANKKVINLDEYLAAPTADEQVQTISMEGVVNPWSMSQGVARPPAGSWSQPRTT